MEIKKVDLGSVHNRLFNFLYNRYKGDSGFFFTLRNSNQGRLLSKGYWFDGNDSQIAISFWTGIDFKRKVPNISFIVSPNEGTCFLQISVLDSPEKEEILSEMFENFIGIKEIDNRLYQYEFEKGTKHDYIFNLSHFVENEKEIIDNWLKAHRKKLLTKQNTKNRIGFITQNEFVSSLKNTLTYRSRSKASEMPSAIRAFSASDFGPVKNLSLRSIPDNTQWIFLTGENGTGKTTVLKAIATAIIAGNLRFSRTELNESKYSLSLKIKNRNQVKTITKNGQELSIASVSKMHAKGFVAIGPSRLNVHDIPQNDRKRKYQRIFKEPWLQLFVTDGFLNDIGTIYNSRGNRLKSMQGIDEKIKHITRSITSICDSIVDINFSRGVRYFEIDATGKIIEPKGVPFQHLASGYRSVVAMISHIMIHLYLQQPDVDDPSELCGVVIVDEIDLHFHPKMQKQLITKLGEIFPLVQFIVSTHSPIPLLGAPKNSVIYTLTRTARKGVIAERMDLRVPFDKLLPNSLLTSPVFGLNDITPESHTTADLIWFNDNFRAAEISNQLEEEVNSFITGKKERDLIKLFKDKK